MSSSLSKWSCGALVLAASLLCASIAEAQLAFKVTMNTSALSGNALNPLYLDFQLNDGSGAGDGNNTAWISNFSFSSGSALAPASTFGGASGNFASGVTLTDSSAFNEFFQPFIPGSSLSFTVNLTTHVDGGLVPDMFSFAILDSNLFNLPTQSAGTDAFLSVNLDSAHPDIAAFAGVNRLIAAPVVTPVPEPSTYGAFAAGALLLLGFYRSRRAARASA